MHCYTPNVLSFRHTLWTSLFSLFFYVSSISPPTVLLSPALPLISLLLSVTFHLSLSDVVSLVSRRCVYQMVDLSSCDGSFLSSVCEHLCTSVCSLSCLFPPGEENVQTVLPAVAVSILCLTGSSVVTLLFGDFKSEYWRCESLSQRCLTCAWIYLKCWSAVLWRFCCRSVASQCCSLNIQIQTVSFWWKYKWFCIKFCKISA